MVSKGRVASRGFLCVSRRLWVGGLWKTLSVVGCELDDAEFCDIELWSLNLRFVTSSFEGSAGLAWLWRSWVSAPSLYISSSCKMSRSILIIRKFPDRKPIHYFGEPFELLEGLVIVFWTNQFWSLAEDRSPLLCLYEGPSAESFLHDIRIRVPM